MYFTKKRNIVTSIFVPFFALIGTALSVGTYTLYRMESTITSALCPPITVDQTSESSVAEGFELAKQIVAEGSILVKNDNQTLPLNKDAVNKVNVFGHGAVDWIVGGSGSGQVRNDGQPNINFVQALGNYGISVNQDLLSFQSSYASPRGTVDSLNQFYDAYYIIDEPPFANYTDALKNGAKNFSDTAFVVISRRAGETEDPPRHQNKKSGARDTERTYLEISTEEEDMLRYVGANFENVVVIINSTNTMKLGFLDTIPGLDACLIVGATGTRGAAQIPYILYGDGSFPSGRTVDTYAYDFKTNINYGYTGIDNIRYYSNATSSSYYPVGVSRNAGESYSKAPTFVDYAEGIYVGYKWYETADAEGYWDRAPYNGYENVVQFPFGHGLSYTTFDWELVSTNPAPSANITNTDTIEIEVLVTNTGNHPGKDVVEAYVTAPYTPGGIEKSYVTLVATTKTAEIAPGQNQKVKLTIPVKDFESYDYNDANKNGHFGYELEAGEYQVKLMTDSHNVKTVKSGATTTEGVIKYNVATTIKVTHDEVTGAKVENRFTGDTAEFGISIDGTNTNQNIPFVKRNALPQDLSTFKTAGDREMDSKVAAINRYTTTHASQWDNATTDIFGKPVPTTKPTWGKNSGNYKLFNGGAPTELGYQLAANYDDPKWGEVLDSITLSEAVTVTGQSSWRIAAINSVGKPTTAEYDGPAQVKSFNAGSAPAGTAFPCGTVVAQTWSTSIGRQFGLNYGKEMSSKGVDGLYGFGCNIHRSPFQGRNYEYLSECGNLTSIMLVSMVDGLQDAGKYCFLKHLVAAECEHTREAIYTWMTEQSFREIYLKPFQKVIQDANCVGIMSSYNRIGGIWTGGSEHLIQGMLRYEWGFKGAIITDYADHSEFMNGANANRVGSNLGLNTNWSKVSGFSNPTDSSSPRLLHRLRDAVKEILYMTLYVKYQNDQYNKNPDSGDKIVSTTSIASWEWWKPALNLINMGATALIIAGLYLILSPIDMIESVIKATKARKDE